MHHQRSRQWTPFSGVSIVDIKQVHVSLLTCLCVWYPRLSNLLYICKVKFQKSLYSKIWLLFRGVFRTHLYIYDGAFLHKNNS